jgi:NDP-sugar pyrophosphorylase family protein
MIKKCKVLYKNKYRYRYLDLPVLQFRAGNFFFLRKFVAPYTFIIHPDIKIGKGTIIEYGANLQSCKIGSNCLIGEKCRIIYGVIKNNVLLENTKLIDCTVHPNKILSGAKTLGWEHVYFMKKPYYFNIEVGGDDDTIL